MKNLALSDETRPIVKSSLDLKRKIFEKNLNEYQKRLSQYEKNHKMNSRTFKKKFDAGELGDDRVWFDWMYVYSAYKETKKKLRLLESVIL